jgi:hypothetical protein
MKHALVVYGGWDGHQPELVAALSRTLLEKNGFEVTLSTTLDSFLDATLMAGLDLIVPIYTMSKITKEQCQGVLDAVAAGTGLGGCHGGMCDAFRENVDWQFLTGGQWVAHPGNDGVEYSVIPVRNSHPIVEGIEAFTVKSEQYYLHVDPAVKVLATTEFPVVEGPHSANGRVAMPVVWTKFWGKGRVFYTSLGHHCDILEAEPARTIYERGLVWAAR